MPCEFDMAIPSNQLDISGLSQEQLRAVCRALMPKPNGAGQTADDMMHRSVGAHRIAKQHAHPSALFLSGTFLYFVIFLGYWATSHALLVGPTPL